MLFLPACRWLTSLSQAGEAQWLYTAYGGTAAAVSGFMVLHTSDDDSFSCLPAWRPRSRSACFHDFFGMLYLPVICGTLLNWNAVFVFLFVWGFFFVFFLLAHIRYVYLFFDDADPSVHVSMASNGQVLQFDLVQTFAASRRLFACLFVCF